MLIRIVVIACIISTFLLSGCGGGYRPESKTSDVLTSGVRNTDELLRAAALAKSPIRENMQLQAADILLQAGDAGRGMALLFNLDSQYLSDRNFATYTLLYGHWAIDKDQTDLARRLFTHERLEKILPELDVSQAIELYGIRADFFARDKQMVRSLSERMALTPLLMSDQEQEHNNNVIWSVLQQLSSEEMQQLRHTADKQMEGWIELTHIATAQELDIDDQVSLLNEWLDHFPRHPAAQHLPPELQLLQTAIKQRPQHITLLLPLSGNLQKAGEAVRDGFMAAYYQAMNRQAMGGHAPLPQIRIIDSQRDSDFLKLYAEAADGDTDLIIGPLEKDKVTLLQTKSRLAVPTLALNDVDNKDITKTTTNLYFFGLNPEDEARQTATEARLNHHDRALVIAPSTDWGQRVSSAFFHEWQAQGGTALGSVLFDASKDDYSDVIQQALGVADSKTRKQWLRQWTADSLEFEPRRRQDVDVIFLATRPEQARQIKPLLAFHYAGDIPVYASSSVFSGVPDPDKDADLNGIQLMVSPWLLQKNELKTALDKLLPAGVGFQSLNAMGADAWRLHARLILLSSSERSRLHGYTGILRMDSHQRIYRQQLWVKVDQGKISLVPSLTP